ncbi:hypothetical protein ACQB60_11010 [Actinomycetota bacterium Odt1-20B]
MSDQQRYEGYDGYDPYQQQQQQQQYPYPGEAQQQPVYPDPQQYQQPQQAYPQQQFTQQWEGQTWETQVQPPPAPAANLTETAYLPPQSPVDYGAQQQPEYGARPLPPETPAAASYDGYNGYDGYAQQEPQPQHQYQASPPDPVPAPAPAPAPAPTPAPVQEPASDDGPGYGPATTTGNPRVTDAQRARAEGRSPIIEPGIQPAALTALLGLLLAGGAAVGSYALLVPLVILQAVTAAGWFRLNGMWPARQGIALAFLGGAVADAALLATGKEHAPAAILGTLGVWVLLVVVLQLRSRAGADERMYGLMATVASSALAIIAAGHLAAADDAVTVGAVAVGVAVLARALPLPTPASVVVALLAAAGAGIAVGGMTGLGSKGALLGLGAGVCALIGHRVASYDYPSRFVHMTAGVALPLAAAAPAVYVLGRAIG